MEAEAPQNLILRPELAGRNDHVAILNAIRLWAASSTLQESTRRDDLMRDKQRAVESFFSFVKKHPGEVNPLDVRGWQSLLESKGLSATTIYVRSSFLSSFYEWAMQIPELSQHIGRNPVSQARPRSPKAYQTASVKSLTDEELEKLVSVVSRKAQAGELVGKRDYAILMFFMATGMRRSEVISLRGRDLKLDETLIVTNRVKGGTYIGREVSEPLVREALLEYLRAAHRLEVLKNDGPLWTRHDRAGRPGAQLSSHCYVKNLKRYAREAGIESFHLHQTRHTFARIVAEETGSIIETQDALNHKNPATTRIYVQRIAVKRDRHSRLISKHFAAGKNSP
jgi:integrase/recombinase XerC